jgi:hypothetical protein
MNGYTTTHIRRLMGITNNNNYISYIIILYSGFFKSSPWRKMIFPQSPQKEKKKKRGEWGGWWWPRSPFPTSGWVCVQRVTRVRKGRWENVTALDVTCGRRFFYFVWALSPCRARTNETRNTHTHTHTHTQLVSILNYLMKKIKHLCVFHLLQRNIKRYSENISGL